MRPTLLSMSFEDFFMKHQHNQIVMIEKQIVEFVNEQAFNDN